ncbi:MAG: response regulator receiver protein [Cyclobacteriaceae bacterium]|nr:response regulator receiver protein [Cyclobacteriaceae bacterium]
MSAVNILVIGRHAQIMETVLRLVNTQPYWHAQGALTDDEARQKFSASAFDVVLIGGGVEEESEQKLKQTFLSSRPDVKVIRHYGGGSGLLFNEIQQAING